VDIGTTGPGAPPTPSPSSEGIGSFFEGLVFGGLSDNDSWSATAGSVLGGLIPGVGLAADIRDLSAAIGHVASGKDGAWLELGASIIGFVPGGDIAKGIAKGVTKATTKGAAKVASEAVQEVAKVAKASTAKAADTVSNAQRAVKGPHATPRGPPVTGGPDGTIYRLPGNATSSGKPYVGRHKGPQPQQTRKSPDGRDRTKAEVVDRYDASKVREGRLKEQQAIDREGGVGNLDNKRNEIAPKKREGYGL
jgi:hypothetical protein